ncbi:GAG-pre-integrase domain [Popillia japonica]|uniref:GAG-pre-integrase domain n=1 Tax=Popillia japonica TaxID=7064 RepID=A0AAW1LE16_POPJA
MISAGIASLLKAEDSQDLMWWHRVLAHQNFRHVKEVLLRNKLEVKDSDTFCSACIQGKHHREPFPVSTSRSNEIGGIIHMDLCGPMEEASLKFVGYTENTKGYRVFFPDVNMVSIEREIIFTPESIRKNADDNEETLVRLDINNSEEMQSEEEPEDAISTRDDEEEVFQQPSTIAEKTDDRLRPRQTLKPPTRFDDFATSYFSVDEDEPTTYEEAMASDYASEWQATRTNLQLMKKQWLVITRVSGKRRLIGNWKH